VDEIRHPFIGRGFIGPFEGLATAARSASRPKAAGAVNSLAKSTDAAPASQTRTGLLLPR
jgi:hypothetical protein